MSVILQSNFIKHGRADVSPSKDGEVVHQRAEYLVAAAIGANNVIEMLALPPNMEVVDGFAYFEDVDSGTAAVAACGLMIGTPGDTVFANRTTANAIGTQFFSGSTVPQTGGIQRFLMSKAAMDNHYSEARRSIGIQFTTAPGTTVTAKKVYLEVLMASFFKR